MFLSFNRPMLMFNKRVVNEICWGKYCTDWLCSKYNWRHNNDVIFVKKFHKMSPMKFSTNHIFRIFSYFENWQNYIVLLLIYDTTLFCKVLYKEKVLCLIEEFGVHRVLSRWYNTIGVIDVRVVKIAHYHNTRSINFSYRPSSFFKQFSSLRSFSSVLDGLL